MVGSSFCTSGSVAAVDGSLSPVGKPVRLDRPAIWTFANPTGRGAVAVTETGVTMLDLEHDGRDVDGDIGGGLSLMLMFGPFVVCGLVAFSAVLCHRQRG